MKRTETVKTYATNLIEFITGIDLITDEQAEALKGGRIRSLTRDTIVTELADINAPFLVYNRTKNALLCTESLVVLTGEVDVVNGMALAIRRGMWPTCVVTISWKATSGLPCGPAPTKAI